MWFKNLIVYQLNEPFRRTAESLGAALLDDACRPCGNLEPFSYGWASPMAVLAGSAGDALVHSANGVHLIMARREERVLPPAVVRDAVTEKVRQIEAEQFRTVFRKERQRIRDEMVFEMLPRAFTKGNTTAAYIAPESGLLVVDAATPRKAEDLVVLLGQSLGGLDIQPWMPEIAPGHRMTEWLSRRQLPGGIELGNDCELRDPADERALVRCQHQDLMGDELRAHLQARKRVHRLGLVFEGRLSFQLGADFTFRRLKFEAVEENDGVETTDEAARVDADFAFMTIEFGRMFERMMQLFNE